MDFEVHRCRACGFGFSWPRPSWEVIEAVYRQYDPAEHVMNDPEKLRAVHEQHAVILRDMARYVPPGRLLDVGAGNGLFMDAARKAGWDTFGIEPSRQGLDQILNQFGFSPDHVFRGTLEEYPVARAFDAATLLHVFEHVYEPGRALEKLYQLIGPSGILLIIVPNFHAADFKQQGFSWD